MQSDSPVSGPNCPSCNRARAEDSRFCQWCGQLNDSPAGVFVASFGQRVGAFFLDLVLFFLTLAIGYIVWWLIVLDRGQTPGKQIVGIRVIKDNGEPSMWGYTFLREFVIKGLLVGLIGMITLEIFWFVDNLWAAWDKDKQTLHDKIIGTLLVEIGRVDSYA